MRKIGILGGTFNPIHTGHLLLAETARQSFSLDEVLLIPSGCSYMKDPKEILPGPVRFAMVKLAAGENPCFTASDMEITRQGNSYTCDTLLALKEKYPDSILYYIVGADTIFHMESWKNPAQIFANCVTLAAVRKGYDQKRLQEKIAYLCEKYRTQIYLLPSLYVEISSTDIRSRCSAGKSIRYLVPEPVRHFLEQEGCYRKEPFS